jgi:phosphoribosylaminoimidazole carboxylase (NCAIR synthetase)
VDVLTVEIEHVDVGALERVQKDLDLSVSVHPSLEAIRTIQDKLRQKELSYPAVETVHKNNICHLVFAPLRSRDLLSPAVPNDLQKTL